MAAPAAIDDIQTQLKKRVSAQQPGGPPTSGSASLYADPGPQALPPEPQTPQGAPLALPPPDQVPQTDNGPQALPPPDQVPQTDNGPLQVINSAPQQTGAPAGATAIDTVPQMNQASSFPQDLPPPLTAPSYRRQTLGGYQQVATAPDGVPVYRDAAGKFYTQNPDGSYVEQFQGGQPDWLTQQAGGSGGASGGGATPPAGGDVNQALTQFYQSMGKTPSGPGSGPTDIAYFAKRITETGGMTPQNIAYWFGPNGRIAQELRGEVPPEGPAGGTPPNVGGAPGGAPAPPVKAPEVSPFMQQIRDILMKRLAAAQGPVDPNAAEIAQPFEAAQIQTGRGGQMANAIAAEQAYAASARGGGGIDQGALGRGQQQVAERGAANLAGVKSGLIQKAYAQKQNELQSDLQMALAVGDAEAARAIQVELANLQAALTRESLGVQLAGMTNSQNNYPFSFFG